jgi:hypothetical protein
MFIFSRIYEKRNKKKERKEIDAFNALKKLNEQAGVTAIKSAISVICIEDPK